MYAIADVLLLGYMSVAGVCFTFISEVTVIGLSLPLTDL